MNKIGTAFEIPKAERGSKKNKQEKHKMNKYEKSIYRPIKIITILGVTLIIINLLFSPIKGVRGIKSIFQWGMCFMYVVTILNSRGFSIEYNIPLGWSISLRLLEIIIHVMPYTTPLNYSSLFILLIMDIAFFCFVMYHKLNYEFEVEKYDK